MHAPTIYSCLLSLHEHKTRTHTKCQQKQAMNMISAAAAILLVGLLTMASAARSPEASSPPPASSVGGRGGLPGDFFGPGWQFTIPGGGGSGVGYSGPGNGYSQGGISRQSVACSAEGPCHMKWLTCPANCFSSFSRAGKGYGEGGGGGGCTIDCIKCVAYC